MQSLIAQILDYLPLGCTEGVNIIGIVENYRSFLAQDLICVTKQNYRRLRRLGVNLSKVKTTELALSIRPGRCKELQPFITRHKHRFARFVRLYDVLYTSSRQVTT